MNRKIVIVDSRKEMNARLALFTTSLTNHGVTGVDIGLVDGQLIIKQEQGQGIRGLGYDKAEQSLWLCLDQLNPQSVASNQLWNANTILSLNSKFSGVEILKIGEKVKIIIAPDHPVATLANLLVKAGNVYLPGGYNNWDRSVNPFAINQNTNALELVINWNGEAMEGKVAIKGVSATWSDGNWARRTLQTMAIQFQHNPGK